MSITEGNIKVRVGGAERKVWVADINSCPEIKCFTPYGFTAKELNRKEGAWQCAIWACDKCPKLNNKRR